MRISVPIFMLWRPRNQERLSTICVTEVVKSALPLDGGPICWNPTTSKVGRVSEKDEIGMFGIPDTCDAATPVRNERRLNPRRVYPKRSWLTLLPDKVQLCSAATLSARVSVSPTTPAVRLPLPSGSGGIG